VYSTIVCRSIDDAKSFEAKMETIMEAIITKVLGGTTWRYGGKI
jgi:hypothetical protein